MKQLSVPIGPMKEAAHIADRPAKAMPITADILADLNRAKCVFQLSALIAAMGRV